jgi:hypothetical protein
LNYVVDSIRTLSSGCFNDDGWPATGGNVGWPMG